MDNRTRLLCPKEAPEVVLYYIKTKEGVRVVNAMINGDFISKFLFEAAFINSVIRWETIIEEALKK